MVDCVEVVEDSPDETVILSPWRWKQEVAKKHAEKRRQRAERFGIDVSRPPPPYISRPPAKRDKVWNSATKRWMTREQRDNAEQEPSLLPSKRK